MRIDEAEGRVLGERDALPGRGKRRHGRGRDGEGAGEPADGGEVAMARDEIGEARQDERRDRHARAPVGDRDGARAGARSPRAGARRGPECRAAPSPLRSRRDGARCPPGSAPIPRGRGGDRKWQSHAPSPRRIAPDRVTSSTSSTGRSKARAISAAEPRQGTAPGAPSNSPMADSMTRRSASPAASCSVAASKSGGMAQPSRLRQDAPEAAA